MQCSKIVTSIKLPLIGFGTYRITGYNTIYKSIDAALKSGYRLIDTATDYNNEEDIGKCLKELLPKHGLSRADVFITSKLPPDEQGHEGCRRTCEESLRLLQCDYLDLYLIHWPGTQWASVVDERQPKMRSESWREMEKMYEEGKLKAIGVSNYTIRHLEELLAFCSVKPCVNQVEYHPFLVQTELHEYCINHGIQLEAYSSLGSTQDNILLTDKTVAEIAKGYKKSPAQVLLKWALQQDIMILPKSTNPERIAANIDLSFQICDEDMKRLSSLSRGHHFESDPTNVN